MVDQKYGVEGFMENIDGLVARLQTGTIVRKGEVMPLGPRQILNRVNELVRMDPGIYYAPVEGTESYMVVQRDRKVVLADNVSKVLKVADDRRKLNKSRTSFFF